MILNTNFACIDDDHKKSFCNQNLIYNRMESCYQKSEPHFTSIEAQLARLGIQPQAPIVQFPHPYRVQYQAIPLLAQEAAIAGPPPPQVPPLSSHVCNITPSPPNQQQQRYQLEIVAGNALPPVKFCDNMKNLERWILLMNGNFTITQTHNEQ